MAPDAMVICDTVIEVSGVKKLKKQVPAVMVAVCAEKDLGKVSTADAEYCRCALTVSTEAPFELETLKNPTVSPHLGVPEFSTYRR